MILVAGAVSLSLMAQEKKEPAPETKQPDKYVCITFDIVPGERVYEREERKWINQEILSALESHEAKAAGFVVGDNIESGWDILADWLQAGHILGSMTYTGQDVTGVPVEIFIDDIARGDETLEDLLVSFKQKERYFRFPYLHYGQRPEIRLRIEQFLHDRDIKIAHSSVVTEDFVFNLSLEKNLNSQDSLTFIQLGTEYISHVMARLEDAESLAVDIMGRPIKQIVELRSNRLNGLFLDDLLTVLHDEGYDFVSLDEALKDRVYRKTDAYYGWKVISFLERIIYSDPDLIPAGE